MQDKLTVFERNEQLLVDSREVATAIGKEHKDLMKQIRQYVEYLAGRNFAPGSEDGFEGKISPVEFFIESNYLDAQNQSRPCYLLTKKGCDMVANKLTGQKGVIFTARYVSAFETMKEHIEKGKQLPPSRREETMLNNSRARLSAEWRKLAAMVDDPDYKQICAAYASRELTGKRVLPLPEVKEQNWSAAEVGKMLGVSAQKIGSMANKHELKTAEYGKWYHDKSPYSAKEVNTFRYNSKAVERLRKLFQ